MDQVLVGVPCLRSVSSTSFRMTVKRIMKRYGLSGHPCLIPAATSPCAILPLRPLILKVGES